jgi:hypothetical protein
MAAVDTCILIGLAIYVAITMDWVKSKEEDKQAQADFQDNDNN